MLYMYGIHACYTYMIYIYTMLYRYTYIHINVQNQDLYIHIICICRYIYIHLYKTWYMRYNIVIMYTHAYIHTPCIHCVANVQVEPALQIVVETMAKTSPGVEGINMGQTL